MMQQLLDFIYEHALDERVFLLVLTRDGRQLELFWRRDDPREWLMRDKETGEEKRFARDLLLSELIGRGAHMGPLRQELDSIVTTQIVYADMLLTDAKRRLGRDRVQRAVLTHRDFVGQLGEAMRGIQRHKPTPVRDPLRVVKGGGRRTSVRRGHLTLT